jgi:phage-related baseplate assembly protein
MVTFKSFNDIVLDILDRLRLTQPSLDTKPNSVARDLFVDAQAFQMSGIYDALREIAALQSVSNLTGQDLTNYGSNFGVTRTTGTRAIGTAVFTFRSIDTDITIPQNSVVRTRNGIPFLTVSSIVVRQTQSNSLRATATRLRNELNTAGITDEFALEVSVQAQSVGSAANISSYSVISHNVSGVNSVTNVAPFTGGTDLEDDASYRTRILATFAGANVGTSLAYRSLVLGLADAIDALVIEPGDPLMTRDGTITTTDSDGNLIVSEPGTGGRVDIIVMGENLQSDSDSFVYYDLSGTGDPTNTDNDFILGQSSLTPDTNLTLNSRRLAVFVDNAEIPTQPVNEITSVSGSSSGPNFVEQYLDEAGNLQGNYVLVKDTGSAGGSPFGLDKLRWTSNQIELTDESLVKGPFNGIDALSFTDVLEIPGIREDVQVTNENATVGSTRSSITVKHTPVRTVSRVFNLTTGERYTISNQNPDSSEDLNSTGRITITGRTLPTSSDVLQVDYIWVREYDQFIDFDNFDPTDNLNTAQDSIEWGYSNYIRDELTTAILDAYNNLTVTTEYPITRVLSVNTFVSESAVVGAQNTVQVSAAISNIHSITDNTLTGNPEIYNTSLADGTFANKLITLPSDTLAQVGDSVTVVYNLVDISTNDDYGSAGVVNNTITIMPPTAVASGTAVRANYVANFFNLLPDSNISSLPISGNGFNSFTGVDGYQPVQNLFSGTTVIANQRRSPTRLKVTTSNLPSNGTLSIVGTTINKVTAIYTATSAGLDLAIPIRVAEGLSSTATIPSTISVARVESVEQVSLTVDELVKSVDVTNDLTNYGLRDASWDRANAIEISSLGRTQVQLAATDANTGNNAIVTGTNLRVTFYYSKTNDYESLFYSRDGVAYTEKVFGYISSVNRLSGFQDSGGTISGTIQIDTFNQPAENSAYFADYDYTAPKENERITINYEYNKLIVDAANTVEDNRPITADVLTKSATKIELDVQAYIVVDSAFSDRETTVRQDVADNITATLSADALGTTLDSSDIIDNAYNVEGLDRIRITRFNKANVSGTKLSIKAQKNEYLAPGTVDVEVEDR